MLAPRAPFAEDPAAQAGALCCTSAPQVCVTHNLPMSNKTRSPGSGSRPGLPGAPPLGALPASPGHPKSPALVPPPGRCPGPLPRLVRSRCHHRSSCVFSLVCLPFPSSRDMSSCGEGFSLSFVYLPGAPLPTAQNTDAHISQARVSGPINQSKALPNPFPSFWVMRGALGATLGARLKKQSASPSSPAICQPAPARPWPL